eukprot:gnl/TRDRNA2_/TRDRNA2_135490_c1_seq1.p1 gnl/TRDRNA2_/TRDRNA2_135490_c1~~gnl/TRDRNA2_/TRDRNA2_135490_c1_seq1.p1  ORF type:complete len:193 (-),score=48.66 gnl/TRDRNA2_/TRDRNA2_135490_c1_seq1:13-591(-)
MLGVPFQYTLSKELRARLEFLREQYQVKESEFLNFDAMRQASQCMGRVIRSKRDYGIMIFADQRFARQDKRSKIPEWIQAFMEPGHLAMATDVAVQAAKSFLLRMSQPIQETVGVGGSVLSPMALYELIQKEAGLEGVSLQPDGQKKDAGVGGPMLPKAALYELADKQAGDADDEFGLPAKRPRLDDAVYKV